MHDKIKELAGMALDQALPQTWTTLTAYDLDKFTGVFAELIVRECVRYFNEDYQRDFHTLWREDLTKGIKEHFGVEE